MYLHFLSFFCQTENQLIWWTRKHKISEQMKWHQSEKGKKKQKYTNSKWFATKSCVDSLLNTVHSTSTILIFFRFLLSFSTRTLTFTHTHAPKHTKPCNQYMHTSSVRTMSYATARVWDWREVGSHEIGSPMNLYGKRKAIELLAAARSFVAATRCQH